MPILPRRSAFALLPVLCILPGCTRSADAGTRKAPLLSSLDQGVNWLRDVRLQENSDVINVTPRVEVEAGRFLVTDSQEDQVRLYGADGTLIRKFGRRGSGPGEFEHISRGVRLRDGRFLVADMTGPLTVFDSTGTHVLHTARPPLSPIYDVEVLDDSQVVITGRLASGTGNLVHIWNVNTDRLTRSFFTPPAPPRGLEGAFNFTGFADAAVRGDTVAALFGLADTVYLFRADGTSVGKLPIRFNSFRKLDKPIPQGSMTDFQTWVESFSAASDLFWMSDGGFLVQYFDQKGAEQRWNLTRLSRAGDPLWEVIGSPRLLAASRADSLVFVKPDADAPNLWAIARLAGTR